MLSILNYKFQTPISLAIIPLLIILLASESAHASDKVYDNNDVKRFIGKSDDFKNNHSVMIAQRERLKDILNAFLIGDTQTINNKSDELLGAMSDIVRTHPLSRETEYSAWHAMNEIVEEAHLMKTNALVNDYDKAYEHFSKISSACIECHQTMRQWGKLPKQGPDPSKESVA